MTPHEIWVDEIKVDKYLQKVDEVSIKKINKN